MTNKVKILQTAIELFAQKGYANVSMREIASAVNIKAASIYNHYAGKEALLEEIVSFFRDGLYERVYPAFLTGESVSLPEFFARVADANDRFFADPLYGKIGSIVLREQFTNESVRRLLLEELIIKPREVIAAHFANQIAAGMMIDIDPLVAAKEYHAFYIYRFYENSLASGNPPPDLVRSKFEEDKHVFLFLDRFCTKKQGQV